MQAKAFENRGSGSHGAKLTAAKAARQNGAGSKLLEAGPAE